MASIEFIQKRIAGKEAELSKLEKKMERILKAKESNYEQNNPYYYSDYDFRATTRDIEEVKEALERYKAQLTSEEQKSASRNVQVILDFLDEWKARVYEYYMNSSYGLVNYYKEAEEWRQVIRNKDRFPYGSQEYKDAQADYEAKRDIWYEKIHGRYEKLDPSDKRYRRWHTEEKVAPGIYEWLKDYTERCSTVEEADTYLKKVLDQEANRKYDEMIERTNAIVGQITDASGLRIGEKGDLNGIVVGTTGKASVQTIGAGGYNIQCYHYRTLIKPVK